MGFGHLMRLEVGGGACKPVIGEGWPALFWGVRRIRICCNNVSEIVQTNKNQEGEPSSRMTMTAARQSDRRTKGKSSRTQPTNQRNGRIESKREHTLYERQFL